MTTQSDARELVEAADCAGCRVLAKSRLDMGDGSSLPVLELECGDNVTAIRFLNHAARKDTGDPEVRDLALRLLSAHPDELPQAVHVFVKWSSASCARKRRRSSTRNTHSGGERAIATITRGASSRSSSPGEGRRGSSAYRTRKGRSRTSRHKRFTMERGDGRRRPSTPRLASTHAWRLAASD